MTHTAALNLVLSSAEAHANGHYRCREIIEAVEYLRKWVRLAELGRLNEKEGNREVSRGSHSAINREALCESGSGKQQAAITPGVGRMACTVAEESTACEEGCRMCSGECCQKCGAGCWDNQAPFCEHDVIDRHDYPKQPCNPCMDDNAANCEGNYGIK